MRCCFIYLPNLSFIPPTIPRISILNWWVSFSQYDWFQTQQPKKCKAGRLFQIYHTAQQLPVAAHCRSKPSYTLIGKFEMNCTLQILWLAKFDLDVIKICNFHSSFLTLRDFVPLMAIIIYHEQIMWSACDLTQLTLPLTLIITAGEVLIY